MSSESWSLFDYERRVSDAILMSISKLVLLPNEDDKV